MIETKLFCTSSTPEDPPPLQEYIRNIIKIFETNAKSVEVNINEKILNFIENYFSEDLGYFKKKNKIKINLNIGENLGLQEY